MRSQNMSHSCQRNAKFRRKRHQSVMGAVSSNLMGLKRSILGKRLVLNGLVESIQLGLMLHVGRVGALLVLQRLVNL